MKYKISFGLIFFFKYLSHKDEFATLILITNTLYIFNFIFKIESLVQGTSKNTNK